MLKLTKKKNKFYNRMFVFLSYIFMFIFWEMKDLRSYQYILCLFGF